MRGCVIFTAYFLSSTCFLHLVVCIEPISGISAAAALVAAAFLSGYDVLKSYVTETCGDRWIHNNYTGLPKQLNEKLYGQHLVLRAVNNHIRGHLKSAEPAKALALSFHGWTGTGKNYVSRIVAEHLYKEGMHSKFVHLISATKEFPHEGMVPFYKDQLRAWIEGNITRCSRSLFIFDEMDKMPSGLIDTIKPYLDYYENLGGVNYRKAIFLFLSNTAGGDITQYVYQHWSNGYPRKDIKMADVEKIISRAALNSKTGLWHSELISKHMITAYIPFLPLEKSHVRRCIKDSMVAKGYVLTDDRVESVVEELTFWPESEQVFSVTGCKRVAEKVDYVMEEY
ncbi:torsin-1A-like [Haliotis rufescens]|uniref:torsin-1A-like n=1 Tax=Haliotis rufescens TaxID=6454 RepID=UPI00201F87F3|nr:torsin-1A-like [Haliotis rufescens]